jgi:hypothetical protein
MACVEFNITHENTFHTITLRKCCLWQSTLKHLALFIFPPSSYCTFDTLLYVNSLNDCVDIETSLGDLANDQSIIQLTAIAGPKPTKIKLESPFYSTSNAELMEVKADTNFLIFDLSLTQAFLRGEIPFFKEILTQHNQIWLSFPHRNKLLDNVIDQNLNLPEYITSFWSSSLMQCCPLRESIIFGLIYEGYLKGFEFGPSYFPFPINLFHNMGNYQHTCNEVIIFVDALLVAKYLRRRFDFKSVYFITLDVVQYEIAKKIATGHEEISRKIFNSHLSSVDLTQMGLMFTNHGAFYADIMQI